MAKEITEFEITKLIQQLNYDTALEESTTDLGVNNSKDHDTSLDGRIQVNDQTIIVHDPIGNGKPPIIRSEAPVRLIVNDRVVESECVVSSKDRIRWDIEDMPLYEIVVSEDKLEAYFHLHSKVRYAWQLVNTKPMQVLTIRAEQQEDYVLETVKLVDVLARIEEMSIKSNLDIGAVQRELDHPTHQPVLIARGKESVPGKDAELKMYFPEQVKSEFFDVSGRVDYRNHRQIPTASSGDLIARKIPVVKGIPGYDVFGNPIPPAEPKDIIVITKPSAELTPDGEVKALISGRPRVTGNKVKVFDVSQSYIVPGNVDLETGNIVFSGDVVVYGNVLDHMIIESLGNVYVYGSVYNATITATGSIFVRGNVLGGKLYSGYFGVMFNRLYQASKMLGEQIENLITASNMLAQELEKRNQMVRYRQIVMLLIERKFHKIPEFAKELLAVLTNIQHIKKDEYQKLGEMCSVFLKPHKILMGANINFLHSVLSQIQETHQDVARMQESKSEVRLNQCHNSEIKSNGDIVVHGDGVILSSLFAARHIQFIRDSAVCRGSLLDAGGSIVAKVVGGETGVNTFLKAKVKVSVQKMFAGRICVGKRCIDVDNIIEDHTFNVNDMKQRAM